MRRQEKKCDGKLTCGPECVILEKADGPYGFLHLKRDGNEVNGAQKLEGTIRRESYM